jgi:hypothetical protein
MVRQDNIGNIPEWFRERTVREHDRKPLYKRGWHMALLRERSADELKESPLENGNFKKGEKPLSNFGSE